LPINTDQRGKLDDSRARKRSIVYVVIFSCTFYVLCVDLNSTTLPTAS